jgi:FixJ family two-component response regulator
MQPADLIVDDRMSKANPRIAVVDDDAAVRKALMRLLEASSYEVQGFDSAGELIAALPHGVPDCMIVDLQMPNMTGLELQHHLARGGIKIPMIVITAHDEPGTREMCIAAGASAYLLKPLRKAVLIAAINKATKMPN